MESEAFDVTIRSFLTQVSATKPTPGGGSVAAVVTALGCATAAMATAVAANRRNLSAQEHGFLEQHLEGIRESISYMEELCRADERLFDDYLQVLRHAQPSEEAHGDGDGALSRSIVAATEIPLLIASECTKTLERIQDVAAFVRPKFLSDIGISVLLLEAAGQSALLLVDSNMHVIQDEFLNTSMKNDRMHLGDRLSELRAGIMSKLNEPPSE